VPLLLCRKRQLDLPDVDTAWLGDGQSVSDQTLKMQPDCFAHESLRFRMRCACDAHARQRRDVGAPTRRSLFVYHGPGGQRPSFVNPACLRMLPSVPGATSSLGLPATVTRPGLVGCRYWRWLPRWATWRQPSRSSISTSSRNFIWRTLFVGCALTALASRTASLKVTASSMLGRIKDRGGGAESVQGHGDDNLGDHRGAPGEFLAASRLDRSYVGADK
jgi:hypothetical protein